MKQNTSLVRAVLEAEFAAAAEEEEEEGVACAGGERVTGSGEASSARCAASLDSKMARMGIARSGLRLVISYWYGRSAIGGL